MCNKRCLSLILFILLIGMFFPGCKKTLTVEQEAYIDAIKKDRFEKDSAFRVLPDSPFIRDSSIKFEPLHYFDINEEFKFSSVLKKYGYQDTVSTRGTKGDLRKAIRFGFLTFPYKGSTLKVNVYKSWTKSGAEYFAIWFTDKTTGKETYGVGRYLDFELSPDSLFLYTVDFNRAYNPYCSYSSLYSCSIPTKDDFINIEITAGEKKYHH